MIILLLQVLFLYIFSLVGWRYIRQFIVKSPLENIPGPTPISFLKGNFPQLFDVNGWEFHKDIATRYGSVVKLKALLGENQLYVFDPKAMHHIVVKDQYIYEETDQFIKGNRIIFGEGLLATLGDQHRKQRKILNPVFSIAHMREMIPIFWEVSNKLRDTLVSKVKNGAQEIDVTTWMTRTALELVGQSGLGYSFDPLTEHGTPHPYSVAVKQFVPVSFKMLFFRVYALPKLLNLGTPGFRRWLVDIAPSKTLHKIRDIVNLMHATSLEILQSKRKALEEGDEAVLRQVARGKDIMSILMKANTEASEEDRLSEDEILGQMSALIFAAMDTTSTALSRVMYLLSSHENVQEKLRQEIKEARANHGDLGYDTLISLPYLDAVCRETLRLYPPVSQVSRIARQDIILPLSKPIKGLDGKDIHEIAVPKNTVVHVSILSANRNLDIWGEDAFEWKPERWLAPLPGTVKDAHIPGIYSNLMTFIGGGRACIGFKFSQLEMKVVLAMLLESFKFSPSNKEIFWAMNGITTPTVVGGDPSVPSLPMKISLA
ncbi:cytochrome P450 [Cyathus striatus]|nr:cytochrome P450 [Cyathus striatus]